MIPEEKARRPIDTRRNRAGGFTRLYELNLKHFIKDVHKDLNAPSLPFAIGVMGQNGSNPAKGEMLTFQQARMAMNDMPEFAGNVRAIRIDVLVDKAAEKLYPGWEKNQEQWKLVGRH